MLGSIAKIAAPIIGGVASAYGARQANKANQAMSREQMRFQERMSNTAHQREVKDLRAAGLNPVLSATGGQGASSPSGQTATVQDTITPAVGSALQALSTLKQIEKTEAETRNIQTDTNIKKKAEVLEGAKADVLEKGISSAKDLISTHGGSIKNTVLEGISSAKKAYKKNKPVVNDVIKTIKSGYKGLKYRFNKLFK